MHVCMHTPFSLKNNNNKNPTYFRFSPLLDEGAGWSLSPNTFIFLLLGFSIPLPPMPFNNNKPHLKYQSSFSAVLKTSWMVSLLSLFLCPQGWKYLFKTAFPSKMIKSILERNVARCFPRQKGLWFFLFFLWFFFLMILYNDLWMTRFWKKSVFSIPNNLKFYTYKSSSFSFISFHL